jgi:hypothetical protein
MSWVGNSFTGSAEFFHQIRRSRLFHATDRVDAP